MQRLQGAVSLTCRILISCVNGKALVCSQPQHLQMTGMQVVLPVANQSILPEPTAVVMEGIFFFFRFLFVPKAVPWYKNSFQA